MKCRKEFVNYVESNFKRHLETCRGRIFEDKKSYKCTVCFKEFTNLKTLKKHLTTHIKPNKIKSYSCNICEKELSSNDAVKKHIEYNLC